MPVPSRTNKAGAKFNVTTDFPHLGLHSAAATGNVGLVGYALSHGQPINSVLDGVLPLHAACSGGNNLVVKLLIEHGADVNAPRLPRRYSNDKNRDTSAPIVGTSGSTPLHFAAANGHSEVVSTLLQHGAHPDRTDKHGVSPEMLARQNGYQECADLLRDWVPVKDGESGEDNEREHEGRQKSQERGRSPSAFDADGTGSKRLRVQRSIETNLHRPRAMSPPAVHGLTEPSSPTHPPLEEYSFYPNAPHSSDDISARRPSLPHIFENTPKKVTSSPRTTTRRPRSAGTDAEAQPTPPRKLNSKYSLLHLFRRPGDTSSSPTPERSFSTSPSPGTATTTPSTSPHQVPASLPPESPYVSMNRLQLSNDAGSPSAVELHHALSKQQSRERSISGVSGYDDGNSPSTRPGILRAHGRSASSQSQIQRPNSPYRALRFDSSSSILSTYPSKPRSGRRMDLRQSSSPARGLRSNSASSLRLNGGLDGAGSQLPEMEAVAESAPPHTQEFDDVSNIDMDEDEDEYGSPILKSSLVESRTNHRPPTASSSPGLSPIASPSVSASATDTEFPFSINEPPPEDDGESQHLAVPRAPFHEYDSRPRGHSVSTLSSDGSVNPQLSLSGTTVNSSNESSFLSLPGSRSSMSTAKPDDFDTSLERPYSQEEGIIVSSTEAISTGLSERRAHAPLDINIRSISSHAQAEALVQQAQKDILNMSGSAEQGIPSSAGQGRSPLSARLAAYGESLALEKRLKKEEEQKAVASVKRRPSEVELGTSPSARELYDSPASWGSPKGSSRARPNRKGLNRKLSLEQRSKSTTASRHAQRPSTAGGDPSEFLPVRSVLSPAERVIHSHHHHSHHHSQPTIISYPTQPGSPAIAVTPDIDSSNSSDSSSDDPPPAPQPAQQQTSELPIPRRITRSITPDPPSTEKDKDVFNPYVVENAPLTRIASSPQDASPAKGQRDHARQSDNKLSRMGLTSPPPHKSRFGGFKSIVQSLKGKS